MKKGLIKLLMLDKTNIFSHDGDLKNVCSISRVINKTFIFVYDVLFSQWKTFIILVGINCWYWLFFHCS